MIKFLSEFFTPEGIIYQVFKLTDCFSTSNLVGHNTCYMHNSKIIFLKELDENSNQGSCTRSIPVGQHGSHGNGRCRCR